MPTFQETLRRFPGGSFKREVFSWRRCGFSWQSAVIMAHDILTVLSAGHPRQEAVLLGLDHLERLGLFSSTAGTVEGRVPRLAPPASAARPSLATPDSPRYTRPLLPPVEYTPAPFVVPHRPDADYGAPIWGEIDDAETTQQPAMVALRHTLRKRR